MSARDEVVNGLSEHACCFSGEDAKRMVDALMHEAAEQIRNEGAYWGQSSAAGKVYRAAANLIDPAVKGTSAVASASRETINEHH